MRHNLRIFTVMYVPIVLRAVYFILIYFEVDIDNCFVRDMFFIEIARHVMGALSIREFKLIPTGSGPGVSCDADGAFIKVCGLAAVAHALNGGDIAQAQLITLHLQFPTPAVATNGLSRDNLIKFVRELYAGALIKIDWDPDEHPRWPAGVPDSQGGQFAPNGEDASSHSYIQVAQTEPEPVEPELKINGQTRADSLAASEAANAAGEAQAREERAEAAGEDTKETYQSQIDRQLFARQR